MTLKELRLAAGLQQADVAKKLGVTTTAVSNWELGKNAILRKYHKKLARLYGVTVADIEDAVRCTAEGRKKEEK